MNRADKMLAVLLDGKPHSREDIFFRKGFMLTNNAASELRAKGYDVEHWQEADVHYYRLVESSLPEAAVAHHNLPVAAAAASESEAALARPDEPCMGTVTNGVASLPESEGPASLRLFEVAA